MMSLAEKCIGADWAVWMLAKRREEGISLNLKALNPKGAILEILGPFGLQIILQNLPDLKKIVPKRDPNFGSYLSRKASLNAKQLGWGHMICLNPGP